MRELLYMVRHWHDLPLHSQCGFKRQLSRLVATVSAISRQDAGGTPDPSRGRVSRLAGAQPQCARLTTQERKRIRPRSAAPSTRATPGDIPLTTSVMFHASRGVGAVTLRRSRYDF